MVQAEVRTDAEAIEKVKSLLVKINNLRKDKGATEGEAQAAATMLSNLLLKYNLSMGDIDSHGNSSQQRGSGQKCREHKIDFGTSPFSWKKDLAEAVAQHFFCDISHSSNKGVEFIGRVANVDTTMMLLEWLFQQIRSVAQSEYKEWKASHPGQHIDPLRWHLSFSQGATDRLKERLMMIRAEQEREHSEGSMTALAVSVEIDIRDYLEEKFPWRKQSRLVREQQEAERQARKQYLIDHPEEAEAERVRQQQQMDLIRQERLAEMASPQYRKEQARQQKRYEAQERREKRYYNEHGYWPWEKQERTKSHDWRAFERGEQAGAKINLQPNLNSRT